jgi:hypothetical protein
VAHIHASTDLTTSQGRLFKKVYPALLQTQWKQGRDGVLKRTTTSNVMGLEKDDERATSAEAPEYRELWGQIFIYSCSQTVKTIDFKRN